MMLFAGLILQGSALSPVEPPVLRVLLHLVDRGWPERGAIVIPYSTPRGRSFQVSGSDHRSKSLSDINQSDVVFRMHFDPQGSLLLVEDEVARPYKVSTEPSAVEQRTVLRRLVSVARIGPWFDKGLDVGIIATRRDYLVSLSSLGRKAGDNSVIVLSRDGQDHSDLPGH